MLSSSCIVMLMHCCIVVMLHCCLVVLSSLCIVVLMHCFIVVLVCIVIHVDLSLHHQGTFDTTAAAILIKIFVRHREHSKQQLLIKIQNKKFLLTKEFSSIVICEVKILRRLQGYTMGLLLSLRPTTLVLR
jgi:hypothetical protein